jgi:zinc D-Ala-D-Ala carboxypeptidase
MNGIPSITAVADIEARIGSIRARLAAGSPGAGSVGLQGAEAFTSIDLQPADPTAGFDPFGEQYQAAIAQTPGGLADAGGAGGLDSFSSFSLGGNSLGGNAFGGAAIPGFTGSGGYGVATYVGPAGGYGNGYGGAVGSGGAVGGVGAVGGPIDQRFVPTGQPGQSVGKIGGFGPIQVPAELQAYGNGRIPRDALVPIGQGGHRLWVHASAAWQEARAAAKNEAGIDLTITDSYRSYEQQVDLVARKGLYSEGGWGATPGTSSHGWGMAVDVDVTSPATLQWWRANAYRFGFVETTPREPWHWEFRPHQA